MRRKYRSAIYVFNKEQELASRNAIDKLQEDFDDQILTNVLYFEEFRLNAEEHLNYYRKNPEKPFCKTYIEPKIKNLMERYTNVFDSDKAAVHNALKQ